MESKARTACRSPLRPASLFKPCALEDKLLSCSSLAQCCFLLRAFAKDTFWWAEARALSQFTLGPLGPIPGGHSSSVLETQVQCVPLSLGRP